MHTQTQDYPKIPRWISTEDGKWAWVERIEWRIIAAQALSVQQRSQLLREAEQLRERAVGMP